MLKYMLYGAVVMTASYICTGEVKEPATRIRACVYDNREPGHACANRHCQGNLPGWTALCMRVGQHTMWPKHDGIAWQWLPYKQQDEQRESKHE